jgi:hypothetical protein
MPRAFWLFFLASLARLTSEEAVVVASVYLRR